MKRNSVARGAFAVAVASAFGFGATQAFAGQATTYPGSNYCHSTNCNESCRIGGTSPGGYCARDESGYLVCYCY